MTGSIEGPFKLGSIPGAEMFDPTACVLVHDRTSSFYIHGTVSDFRDIIAILCSAIGPEPDTRAADELKAAALDEARDVLAETKERD